MKLSEEHLPARAWAVLAAVAACVPFAAGFSVTRIFYVRDLTMFFWPRHVWLRETLLSGHWPLWDPFAGAGQPVFPDALNQMFLPPVVLLRVLLPAVAGFNAIVIAPFPLAAIGTWLFLRRRYHPSSAAIGAMVFAVSGPVVSTANFPNLSWSIAWIPWLLWAVDRDRLQQSVRSFALLAGLAALQMVSGEPVTMVGTMALIVAYQFFGSDTPMSGPERWRGVARVTGTVAVAGAIAAVQLAPMAAAAQASPRGLGQPDNFWSLHPLWLVESVLPHIFGNSFTSYNAQIPWVPVLNSGRDPFFYSLYVGPVVLLLGMLGLLTGSSRWRFFWTTIIVVSVVLAFGEYTPIYPGLQRLVPIVRTFRFPVKFFLFVSFALAMLVANAAEALRARASAHRSEVPRWALTSLTATGVLMAIALMALVGLVMAVPQTGARAFYELGRSVGLADPVAGVEELFSNLPPVAARALILLLTSALLAYVGWAKGHESRIARFLLFGVAIVELIAVDLPLNPTLSASHFAAPSWTETLGAHPSERFYVGGKFGGSLMAGDRDLPKVAGQRPEGATVLEGRTFLMSTLVMTPAPWHVRELLSYDLPQLWPVANARAIAQFKRAQPAERLRFLARSGVRYCLLGDAPSANAAPLHLVDPQLGSMAVYECVPDARRAYVVGNAAVVPDLPASLARLFDAAFDANKTLMIDREASPGSGTAGAPAAPTARLVSDEAQEVVVEAAAGDGGGYLVLLDSFDPSWRVEVDGAAAELLRANALFRSVRLAPGPHHVRFFYRPTALYGWLAVSVLALLALAAISLKREPRFQVEETRAA